MLKKLSIWIGSLFFGAAALSSPASAGVKATIVNNYAPNVATAVAACIGYEFDTNASLLNCLDRGAVAGTRADGITSYGFAGYVLDNSNQCVQHTASSAPVDAILNSTPGALLLISGTQYQYRRNGIYYTQRTAQYPDRPLYKSGCTVNQGGVNTMLLLNVATTANPGDSGPEDPTEKPDTCILSSKWGALGLPKLAAGAKPAIGHEFAVGYKTEIAWPAWYTDTAGQPAGDPPIGVFFTVEMAAGSECIFRRDTRERVTDAKGTVVHVYGVTYVGPNPSKPPASPAVEEQEIVITGSSKKSKPIVPYGTPFDAAGSAKVISDLAKAIVELENRASNNATTAKGQPIPVKVEVQQAPPVDGRTVNYHHPAPQQLARDNPNCTVQFDPRCAWAPSPTQPAVPETKKEDLVRLSTDGQTIVHNNTSVYNNTVYPKAMVDAGTAPDNTAPDGTVDNPADGTGDGTNAAVDGELNACLDDSECSMSEEAVAQFLSDIGVDTNKDTSPDGVAAGIFDKALGEGTCTAVNASTFCAMAAGFGQLMNRPVPPGDFVWWEGEIVTAAGAQTHKATIPRALIDVIKIFLQLGTALSAISIVLRGKPF